MSDKMDDQMPSNPAATDSELPNSAQHTLYINNMNEKVSLNKIQPVLARLFGRYGEVVSIAAHKNLRMKGQAFVTYKDPQSSKRAIRKLQGRPVFRKPIKISYAKAPSDEEYKILGNSAAVEKRKEAKKAREAEKEKNIAKESKAAVGLSKNQVKQWKALPPHHILLVQNLSDDLLETDALQAKFAGKAGFQGVRLIKFRKLAFVDFDSESSATQYLESTDPPTEFGAEVFLTYAKK